MLQHIAVYHNILQCAKYRYSSSGILYCIAVLNIAITVIISIYCNIVASLLAAPEVILCNISYVSETT